MWTAPKRFNIAQDCRLAGTYVTECENQLKIFWIYTKGTELSIMFWDMYEKVQNCP